MDENEINFKAYIIESINDLRTNPTKFIDEFQTIRYSLLNFKNDSVVEDISKVIDFLQTKNKEDKLILSNGLCKTAAKQIEVFQFSKESEFNQNTSSNKETAEVCAKRYLNDCGKIFQIQDQTTDSSKVVSKILITRTDKEKMNREIVFNPNHKYFGVAVAKVGRIYYFNILFSDKVQETEESTIDEAILEEINLIRSKDEVIINHYNLFEKKFLNEKLNFNSSLINKFYTYLKSQEKFPTLTRSIVLDEIAGILLKKSSETENVNAHNHKDGVYVPEHEEFEGIVGRIISDYTQVDCLFIQGSADNQEDFINRVIFSGRQAHKGVDNLDILFTRKDLLNIGIAYEEVLNTKTKEKEGLVSIILVDQFKSAPKKSFIQIFKDEMTRLRKTPKTFIEDIKKFKERHSFKFKDDEVRYNTALEKLISYLKVCDGLPELTYNEDLHSAAYEYCHYINTPKNKKFFVEDEELLKIRLNHYIDGYKHFSELVYYGDFNATDVIIHLLLKETEKDFKKGEVNVFLGKTFKCFGVGQRVIRDKNLFVLILTDSTRKRGIVENNLKNDLISDINNLRLYPKSFMKFVKLPKNVEYNPFSDPEYLTTEEEKTLDFLSKTRSYGTLLEENELHKAAENYVFEKINTNETNVDVSLKLSNIVNKLSSDRKVVLQTESEDYLKKHLEKFGSGFTHVYNIVDNNLDDFKTLLAKTGEDEPLNSKEYLVHILKVENNRKALLSVNYSYFGLYVHQERKLLNILLTNHFEATRNIVDYDYPYNSKAPRPDLTFDEIDFIRRDFKKLDICKIGKIYPKLIVNIFNQTELNKLNFIYHDALNLFVNEHYEKAEKGVTIEEFVDLVKEYMTKFTQKEWMVAFTILKENARTNNIELPLFKQLLDQVGFRFTPVEAEDIFEKVCYPESTLNHKKFLDIMDSIMKNTNVIVNNRISSTSIKN